MFQSWRCDCTTHSVYTCGSLNNATVLSKATSTYRQNIMVHRLCVRVVNCAVPCGHPVSWFQSAHQFSLYIDRASCEPHNSNFFTQIYETIMGFLVLEVKSVKKKTTSEVTMNSYRIQITMYKNLSCDIKFDPYTYIVYGRITRTVLFY